MTKRTGLPNLEMQTTPTPSLNTGTGAEFTVYDP